MSRVNKLMRVYLDVFLKNLRAETDQEQVAAKSAAMMAASVSMDCHIHGNFAAAERLRDMADQIERQDVAEVVQ